MEWVNKNYLCIYTNPIAETQSDRYVHLEKSFFIIFSNREKNIQLLIIVTLCDGSDFDFFYPRISTLIQMNPGGLKIFATFEIHIADLQMPLKYAK